MPHPNLELLKLTAEKLRPLLPEIVFVGGCATSLLVTDSGPPRKLRVMIAAKGNRTMSVR